MVLHERLNMNRYIVVLHERQTCLMFISTTVIIAITNPHEMSHDDIMTGTHFPYYWPFVRGIHRWQVDSTNNGTSNAKFWGLLWCFPEQGDKQRVEMPLIWYMMTLMWCHCNAFLKGSIKTMSMKNVSTGVLEKLEWAASNGNRYPPYPQLMATAISQ